jgi:hypothetical protein
MMKLRFDFNRLLARKLEDQKVAWPVEKELNEQELAMVTGGWGGDDGCECDDEWGRHFHRHHRHHSHHRHHHDDW